MAKTLPEQKVSLKRGNFLVKTFLREYAEMLTKGRELWGKVSEGDQKIHHTWKVKEEIHLLG